MDIYVIPLLTALLILQQVFWMYTVQRLINKVMSRNYAEVVQADNLKKKKPEIKIAANEYEDDYAANQASKANAILGLIP